MFNKVAYLSLKGGLPSGDTSLHLGELLNRADLLLYSLVPDPYHPPPPPPSERRREGVKLPTEDKR